MSSKLRVQPHLEWIDGSFQAQKPASSPMVKLNVSLMHDAHRSFGKHLKGSRKGAYGSTEIDALADTGCQTCTAGEEFLDMLNCPRDYILPTRHKIVGITNDQLGIIGAVFLRMELRGRTTRQIVYISQKVTGLFLSESALKDLQLINKNFPDNEPASFSGSCGSDDRDGMCDCPQRAKTPNRPTQLPFDPTPENVGKLKQWLVDAFASSAFNQCTHQSFQKITGEPLRVQFKKTYSPWAVHTPIPVAHHWKRQVKADIDQDVRMGVIEPVPQGTPTTWCSRMVVAPKSDGSPRRTVDLQRLNKASLRETHHTPSPFNLVSTVPTNTRKTVLDAWHGYHSLPVAPESKDATTFITEWGRYRYCRAPMGFHASGDAYTRRFDDITRDEERVRRCVDDSILWDDDICTSFWHTFDYMKLCADNGIVFNVKKFQFAQEIVEFAGFEITNDGYRPPKRILDAIEKFPTPESITDVRSWFGLINQVAYTFSRTEAMAPFRELLKGKNRQFYWDETLGNLFEASKQEILRLIKEGVRTFEVGRATCLLTDWAKIGVGFLLMQKHCDCKSSKLTPECGEGHWKLVFAGSRFTTLAESRYSPIEGEALAVVHGLDSCRMFILGCPQLTVGMDHKPLVKFFDDRALETISNPRISALKEKSLMYSFTIEYVPGAHNKGADATSRHPVGPGSVEESEDVECAATTMAIQAAPSQSVTWDRVSDAAVQDQEIRELVEVIQQGFPDQRSALPEHLRVFWKMRGELYVIDSVPFIDGKMLIPSSLRGEVMEGLHAAHQGVKGMEACARKRFFWPGISTAIRQVRHHCRQCNETAPSQPKEPPIFTPLPEFPFQQVVLDLCQLQGFDFLIYADRYSGWVEAAKLSDKTAKQVRKCLMHWFSTFGVPEEISNDGGPPFESEAYDELLRVWQIRKRQSSAYYPQSNGRAEVAVKTAKRILLGNIDVRSGTLDTVKAVRALLAYRNTPLQDTVVSPSEACFGRLLRDHLPNKRRILRKEWHEIADAREVAHAKRFITKPPETLRGTLPQLNVGQAVQVQDQTGSKPGRWLSTGVIAEVLPYRQYKVLIDGSRRITLRNRRFIRCIDPVMRCKSLMPPSLPCSSSPDTPCVDFEDSVGLSKDHRLPCVTSAPPQTASYQNDVNTDNPLEVAEQMGAKESVLPTEQTQNMEEAARNVRRSGRQIRAPRKLVVDPSKKTYESGT